MLQPEIDINRPPLRKEDMLQPEVDINRPPLRKEDMPQPEVDIYEQEAEQTAHRRR